MTDGCAGLAAAIQTVYPRVLHQRCWVHPMRNIWEKVRKRDYDAVKQGAQAILAAAHRLLVMAYSLRKQPRDYQELGEDYLDRLKAEGLQRHLLPCAGWQSSATRPPSNPPIP